MDLEEYQGIIEKTAVYPKEFGAAYTLLGLSGETTELYLKVEECEWEERDKIIKEASDILWYIVATCLELNLDVYDTFDDHWMDGENFENTSTENILVSMMLDIGYISESVKKLIRDGKLKNPIEQDMGHFANKLVEVIKRFGGTLEGTLQINYDKLIKRRETGTLHGSGDDRENQ